MKLKNSKSHLKKEKEQEVILNKWWILGLLGFLIILFVAVVFGTGHDNYIYSSYDFREIFTYQKSYFAKALQEGRFPLWNPHTFSGGPFAANPLVQAFYPPSLMYLISSQPKAVILNYIIAIFAAAGLERVLFLLKRKSRVFLAWTLPVFLVFFTAAWIDITIAAKANTDRLFLPDHGAMENPLQKLHENILIKDPSWYRFWFDFYYFRQNHAFDLDRYSLGGYDNMFLKRYSRFIHHMTDTELDSTIITILPLKAPSNTPGPFPFKILGVKYADYDRQVFEQKDRSAIKRAWFVRGAVRVEDEESALEYMRSDQFKPFQEVVFESPEAERLNLPLSGKDRQVLDPASNVEVVVQELSPEHLRVEIGPHAEGFLILSEIYYPGWRALIDDRSIPVYRADSILRCIPLKENIHQIDLKFRPASVYYGAFIILASFLILLVGLALSSYRCFRMR